VARTTLLAAVLLLGAAATPSLPPIPELPSTGFPPASVAEPFARELMARVPPVQLEALATAQPEILPALFRNFGTALVSRDAALRSAAKRYATALVHAHAQRVPRQFSADDVRLLVIFQVLDPFRYGEDDAYRKAVDSILPQSLSPTLPESLRRAAINELNRQAPIAFETAEALAAGAGLVKTPSGARFTALAGTHARVTTNGNEPIEASIYSINSRYTTPAEAQAFLAAVRAAAPKRQIVVIADDGIRTALGNGLHLDFVDNFSRPLSLWPRDPFSVARTPAGGIVFVNRPNLQHGREEDANMIRVLLDALPPSLEERWKPRWATGGTSFHNGQVLLTPHVAWISIHSVEYRARQLLGADHVPVETFGTAAGIARYTGAVRQAAHELSELYGRPVRFVHELPEKQPLAAQTELMSTLGGGAGFDLDSIVTLLPSGDGKLTALVSDPALGRKLLEGATAADLASLQRTYGLSAGVREAVAEFDASGLQHFLDRCAHDLAAGGVRVQRLPLIMVPSTLIAAASDRPDSSYFLVTWNNVVLEGARAEGFASGLPAGDHAAHATFRTAGYDLALFPPLSRSIILNGGYRCASNEVRKSKL
jgi:hypothetical protein